jgi:AbrB family looped-hinge helix DNA binding protein
MKNGDTMSAIMKISSQRQIRIPKKIMQMLNIETGDFVEIDIQQHEIVLKPRKLIDPSQGWYWTSEWQAMESETDKQIELNDVSDKFETPEDTIKWLKK